jgi:hypothetical protein
MHHETPAFKCRCGISINTEGSVAVRAEWELIRLGRRQGGGTGGACATTTVMSRRRSTARRRAPAEGNVPERSVMG